MSPPVLVAPLAFDKPTSLRAAQVAGAVERGLARAGREADLCPLTCGGAGTEAVLLLALGGEARDGYALIEDGGTAITEDPTRLADAAASGAEVVVLAAADLPPGGGLPERGQSTLGEPTPSVVVLAGPTTDAGARAASDAWRAAGATVVDGTAFVLDALDFQERMLASRAVILGRGTLSRADLRSTLGEAATRARQSGVPAHAIVADNRLDLFDQRILDLQHVVLAGTTDEIEAAAEALAGRL